MYMLTIAAQEGLTIQRILADIPHDAAAIFVYILISGSLWLIWWADRNSGKNSPAAPDIAEMVGDEPAALEVVEVAAPAVVEVVELEPGVREPAEVDPAVLEVGPPVALPSHVEVEPVAGPRASRVA